MSLGLYKQDGCRGLLASMRRLNVSFSVNTLHDLQFHNCSAFYLKDISSSES